MMKKFIILMLFIISAYALSSDADGGKCHPAAGFLTYNTWGVGSMVEAVSSKVFQPPGTPGTPGRFDRMNREIPELGYDVVAFQEVFTPYQLRVLAFMKGYAHRAVGASTSSKPLSSGLLIVSKWPIVRKKTMIFKKCSGAECKASKGALAATVLFPDAGEVDVITTHLNSVHGGELRMAQLGQLARFVEAYNTSNPLVLLGDFNIDPNTRELLDFEHQLDIGDSYLMHNGASDDNDTASGFTWNPSKNKNAKPLYGIVALQLLLGQPGRALDTILSDIFPRRIDYVYFREGRRANVKVLNSKLELAHKVHGGTLSDHIGVGSRFEFN